MSAPRVFTAEQTAAIERRSGPLLLSANAGSGKTSVLVERFVRMVLEDGLEPGEVLAITFTDKAAGELRARVRARFTELGEHARARDLEAAWILTFHGFCARVLRAQAIPAGLDPGFAVLDEAEARELRGRAFDAALAAFLDPDREGHAAALDLVAAYGADQLQELIVAAHDRLRSDGQTRPTLPVPAAAPEAADLRGAVCRSARAALEELPVADARKTIAEARAKLERATDAEAALEDLGFSTRRMAALEGPAVTRHLATLAACLAAQDDAAAIAALGLADDLLGRYADAYAAAKRAAGALDFDDLELLARDVLRAAPDVAAGYAGRFARIMVDEFQDTNHVQLDLLELLDRGHTFVVGDELQSIYGFRHADVGIFRDRRARLAAQDAAATLATNFRSRPSILGVLDAAFAGAHGPGYVPFVPGREEDGALPRRVELLLTDAEAWSAPDAPDASGALPTAPLWRHAEARLVAQRIADLVRDEGVPAGDIVVLLRSAGDMAVFERALEEQGLATLAAGGRGYWGRQQVLDLCAYLGALANPRDEGALFGLLASPLVGLSSDALALVALAAPRGRRWEVLSGTFCAGGDGGGVPDLPDVDRDRLAHGEPLPDLPDVDRDRLAAFCTWFGRERGRAPRLGLDELLERVVDRTGYDLHVLGLPGGRRRLANVHKLQRLASAFEAANGRDVRGLIDRATAELEAEAREPDAPVELRGEQAIRLMTMHAAKGLEFPVVVVADLGRKANDRVPDLLLHEGGVALRLRTVEGARRDALGFTALRAARLSGEGDEERRVLHVAMTRAEERLILSGAGDLARWPAADVGAPPLRWIAPGLVPGLAARLEAGEEDFVADPEDGHARVHVQVSRPGGAALRPGSLAPLALAQVAAEGMGPRLPEPTEPEPGGQLAFDLFAPAGDAPAPTPSATPGPPGAEGARPVRAASERPGEGLAMGEAARHAAAAVAGAPPAEGPPPVPPVASVSYSALTRYAQCPYRFYLERVLGLPQDDPPPELAARLAEEAPPGMDRLLRGSVVHELLEELDFAAPAAPAADVVRKVMDRRELDVEDEHVADVRRLMALVAEGPVARRLAAARQVRREQPFAFPLGDAADTLVNGIVDVVADEDDGTALVVDWKTDDVEDVDLEQLVATSYGAQRRIYALAALHTGAPATEVVHFFVQRPDEPVVARYTAADRERLADELRREAADLVEGHFPVTPLPHRGLCLTCPGRRALCRHPESLTLREPAEVLGA